MSPVNAPTNYKLAKLVVIGMLVQLVVIGYVFYTNYQGRQGIANAVIIGCERGKMARQAEAAFQRTHTKYILSVTAAKSVKEDVKRAAREAAKTYVQTSALLTKQSQLDCHKAYPKARLLP